MKVPRFAHLALLSLAPAGAAANGPKERKHKAPLSDPANNEGFNANAARAKAKVLEKKRLRAAGVAKIDAKNSSCNPNSNPNGKKSCHMTVPLAGDDEDDIEIDLYEHSVRSADYKVLVQGADGELREVTPGRPSTFRGKVVGDDDSVVAASVTDVGVTMDIHTGKGKRVVVEPIDKQDDDEEEYITGDHVVYDAEDVIPDETKMCGAMKAVAEQRRLGGDDIDVDTDDHHHGHDDEEHVHYHPFHLRRHLRKEDKQDDSSNMNDIDSNAAGRKLQSLFTAEVAFEADFEYYSDRGSVVANVVNRIEDLMNDINIQYENAVGIRHEITTIIVHTGPDDKPSSSTDAGTLLSAFRAERQGRSEPKRDIFHLMTGKEIDGGTIGIAWLGVICNQNYGYGLSQSDFNGNKASATDLTAHELGHNWNADHCSCTSHTMNPWITSANVFHPTYTVPDIIAHRNSRTCLETGPGGCTDDSECDDGFVCDTDTRNCVECISNGQCSNGLVCDTDDGNCVECISNGQCSNGLVCDTVTNNCGPCSRNDQCNNGLVCNAVSGNCVECISNGQCSNGLVCDAGAGNCGPCISNGQCNDGLVCDTVSGNCGPCSRNDQCNNGLVCNTGSGNCVPPCSNDQCSDGLVCDTGTNNCVICSSDDQCNIGHTCYQPCSSCSGCSAEKCEASGCTLQQPQQCPSCAESGCSGCNGRTNKQSCQRAGCQFNNSDKTCRGTPSCDTDSTPTCSGTPRENYCLFKCTDHRHCEDNDSCTDDLCNLSGGTCSNTPNGNCGNCAGRSCTSNGDCCSGTSCKGSWKWGKTCRV